MYARLKVFLREALGEFHRIEWPSREATTKRVVVVIVFSAGAGLFLGAVGAGFLKSVWPLLLSLRF